MHILQSSPHILPILLNPAECHLLEEVLPDSLCQRRPLVLYTSPCLPPWVVPHVTLTCVHARAFAVSSGVREGRAWFLSQALVPTFNINIELSYCQEMLNIC